MPRRKRRHGIRKHRNYTVAEVAEAENVARGTVRRWLKAGLPAITDQRPMLILGSDLIAFRRASSAPRQVCAVDEAYCFSCRKPRRPAFGEVEIIEIKGGTARMWALCEVCGTEMYKAIATARLTDLKARVTVTHRLDPERISERGSLPSNDHLR